jgi:hypothetical protein
MNLAPIVLFVYNRPQHTLKTLEALMQNELAEKSELFIYCDGPKPNAKKEELDKIDAVHTIILKKQWCKKVHIIKAQVNKGLANSIVAGVTEIVNTYGKIIVLEDDIVTAKGFLKYMNQALSIYKNEERVMHIASYLPYTNSIKKLPETFFLRFMSCWGWGTWKRAWDQANWDATYLYEHIKATQMRYVFNLDGVLNFHEQLENNISGSIKTWAIMWYTSIFLNGGLCLYPKVSLSKNIGLDGTGENCEIQDDEAFFDVSNQVDVLYQRPKESKIGKRYLKRYYRFGKESTFNKRIKITYLHYRYQFIKLVKRL